MFLLMSILVEGLHEVDAVAVASRGSHPTRAKAPNTTPMDVTTRSDQPRPGDISEHSGAVVAVVGNIRGTRSWGHDGSMTESDDPPGFMEQRHQLAGFEMRNPDAPIGSRLISAADARRHREAFDAEVSRRRRPCRRTWRRRFALANEAVRAVLGDVHRTTSLRPDVVVDVWYETAIRIVINDGWTTPSMFASERPEAFAEVADYFQDQLGSKLGCWPVCDQHDLGLHGEVHDGVAVWWCRFGDHAVAPIGQLGS